MEQLPSAQVLVVTVAAGVAGVVLTVSLGAGAVAGAVWLFTGAEVTTWPQVPLEQLDTTVPQLPVLHELATLLPHELPLQPRLRRPPAFTSVLRMPATAKASANSFKVFMTNSPSIKMRNMGRTAQHCTREWPTIEARRDVARFSA